MASKTAQKPAQKPAPRQQMRQAITLELVNALTPSETKAEQMSRTFGSRRSTTPPSARTSRPTWSGSPTSCGTI